MVSANGQTVERQREYFRKELVVEHGAAAVWQAVTVSSGGANLTGNIYIPQTPEQFTYDADGNLLTDGRWEYTWDAENRLVKVESRSDAPSLSRRKVVWHYDGQGRRMRQTTYDGSSGSWVVTEDLKFVSDPVLFGRHLAELNAANHALVRSYAWGLDLSGTLDGAGGVGGLLIVNSVANGMHFCAYDGNGNVAALVQATDGAESARYEYGPFGEVLRANGPMAQANPFRFSTKRHNDTTDFVLYEFRPYNASLGRWLSRDPIGESGGLNLYAGLDCDAVNNTDYLGQACRVWYKCLLVDQKVKGVMRTCIYNCVEDTSVERQLAVPGMSTCEDLKKWLFKPHTIQYTDSILRCASCDRGPIKTSRKYDESYGPITDCSRSECLKEVDRLYGRAKAACSPFKGSAKVACLAIAEGARAAGIVACDYCTKP